MNAGYQLSDELAGSATSESSSAVSVSSMGGVWVKGSSFRWLRRARFASAFAFFSISRILLACVFLSLAMADFLVSLRLLVKSMETALFAMILQ